MSEQLELKAEQDARRLDSFLAEATGISRAQIQRLILEGGVLLNGSPAIAKAAVKSGDTVLVALPEPAPIEPQAEDIPLSVAYEDADLIVVDKTQGMVVHPAAGNESGTLVNALLYRCKDLSGIGGKIRPGIVHRIDKLTGGLIVAAKNDKAHEALSKQFASHSARRSYIALAAGNFKEDAGTVDAPIERHPTDRKRMCVRQDGRSAVTHWRVIERFGTATFLQFELETGRTHQIRVHMAYLKHPLLGDPVYGSPAPKLGLTGQALFAYRLQLTHPTTGRLMTFFAPLPAYMKTALIRLGWQGTYPEGMDASDSPHWTEQENIS